MSTVVYLANQQIQIVTGTCGNKKISVGQCHVMDAPEGSIINGIIMDTEAFIGCMKEVWAQYRLPRKDVILVINSTKFTSKNIEMPTLGEKKTKAFITREFSDIRQEDEHVCGYFLIGQNKTRRKVYAEMVPSDFIGDYLDIFREIGVRVKAVYSGESSLIRLTAMTVAKQHKTFIMQIMDRMTITTVLWVNGEFYYFNSARCFHEQGTEEYAGDIGRSVSQIRQFLQANQIDYPMEAIVLAGIRKADMPLYQEAIRQYEPNAQVELFSADGVRSANIDVQAVFHVVSGLVTTANDKQNFLTEYHTGRKKEKEKGKLGKGILAIVICLFVMVAAVIVSATINYKKQKELTELEEYNESATTLMEVARYEVLNSTVTYLTNQKQAIEDIDDALYTYPVCNNEVQLVVEKCASTYATVQYDAFDSDAGTMNVTASSDTVDNINKFIQNLNEEEMFTNVEYTGYSYDESTALWDIHVSFTLTESAGREAKAEDASEAEE